MLEEEAPIRGCGTGLGPTNLSDRSRANRGTQASTEQSDHSADEHQHDNYALLRSFGERYRLTECQLQQQQ